jgi:GPH family glycoside/pentoside/hexuronide:cation symporter
MVCDTGFGDTARIPLHQLAAYGFLTVPLAVAGLPIAIYVAPLYTDHLGLGLTSVGIALMATRLLDIFVDPLVGRLSDASRSRFGRRLPFMAAGVPLMMIGTWQVFIPSPGATAGSLFVWLSLFYIGWALVTVPYGAWGAELSNDYHERSRISGTRELWSVVGLLFAVSFPLLVRSPETNESFAIQETAAIASDVAAMGIATLILLPVAFMITALNVPIGTHAITEAKWDSINTHTLLANKPLLLLVGASLLSGLSAGMNQTTVVHYYRHRAGLSEQADMLIFLFFIAALVGAPFWVWLARRLEKHVAMAWSSLLGVIFSAAIVVVPNGNLGGFAFIQLGSGFAYAGPLILGASMAADVIDLDWLRGGQQRSALFVAVFGITKKLSEALGVGIALPMMEAMGFSTTNAASSASQTSLVVVNVVLPSLFAAIAIPFILAYPITEARQRIIRRYIDRRGK